MHSLKGTMDNPGKEIVNLYRTSDSVRQVTVLAPVNRHGQLPAVLVDPMTIAGPVVEGVWLGDSRDRDADGTNFVHGTGCRLPCPQ
jgi:hypothetical protein